VPCVCVGRPYCASRFCALRSRFCLACSRFTGLCCTVVGVQQQAPVPLLTLSLSLSFSPFARDTRRPLYLILFATHSRRGSAIGKAARLPLTVDRPQITEIIKKSCFAWEVPRIPTASSLYGGGRGEIRIELSETDRQFSILFSVLSFPSRF